MQRRNPGATSALLQKANSQLKGERVKKPEDELDAYISSLTRKTSQQQKKSVNFDDVNDSISISSDIEDLTPRQPDFQSVPSSGSKFLKKKPQTGDQDVAPASKFVKKPLASSASPSPAPYQSSQYGSGSAGARPAVAGQPTGGRQSHVSNALSKASTLTGKIQERAGTRTTFTMESDSDESFSGLKLARPSGEQLSESVTTESIKIGRDAGKFLKKASPAPTPSAEVPMTSVTQPKRGQSPEKIAHPQQKKVAPYTLKSSLKYSTDVVLNSEEESLAEFVGGLPSSSGDSWEKDRQKKQFGRAGGQRHTPSPPRTPPPSRPSRRSPSPPHPARSSNRQTPARSTSPSKPPVARRTPSPSPRGSGGSSYLRRRTPSPKLQKSYSDDSNVAESIQSEIADDYDLGVNIILDIDELAAEEPQLEPALRPVTTTSRSESPFRASVRKTEKEAKKSRKSALKSTSQTSVTGNKKTREESPFKPSSKDRESSPFKATDQPRGKSPFKSSNEKTASSFKSGKSSPFRASDNSSPFKAKDTSRPTKQTPDRFSSPFRSSNESSVFKAENKNVKSNKKQTFEESENKHSKIDKSRSSSPFKSSKSEKKSKSKKGKSAKSSKKKVNKEVSDLFGSFGVQTIEDLLGNSAKESEYESVTYEADEAEEIPSEVSEEIKTEKPGIYSYSERIQESVTEIVTVVDTRQSAPSYSEDFDSISEKIGYTSGDRARSSLSDVRTGDETVPDYTEFDESDTETVSSTRSSDPSKSYSDYSYTEDFTKSLVPSRSDLTPVPRSGMRTTEVQTSMDPGLQFQWDPRFSGLAFPGVPLGMGFVDPTPIAAHVVSADALEAMTAYSPAMLALHDMLKAQMELTREFMYTQQRLYADYASRLEPSFHYTTLQDTKNYIKKHRKKRLTFKEALKLVDAEMGH